MRTTTKLGAALAVIGALALSACGGSSPLIDSSASGTRTKNAALGSESGLNVKVFRMNLDGVDRSRGNEWGQGIEDQILRDETKHEFCDQAVTTISNIDSEALDKIQTSCQYEYVMAHMTGFITAPGNPGENVTVKFTAVKDDTFSLKIGDTQVIDAWNNTGCAAEEGTIEMEAGRQYPIDAWYSNFRGNGGCMQLQWAVGAEENAVVPSSAFSMGEATDEGSDSTDSTDSTDNTEAPPTTDETVEKQSFMIDQEDTMLVESDETYDVNNNRTFTAPAGKKFGKVVWASYGTPTINDNELTLGWCHADQSREVVQAAAANKTSFVLPAGNGDYGDPCYGTYKRVKALITLVDDPDYDPANDPNPGVRTDAPDTMFIETAEHFPTNVVAPEGKKFGKVLFASYGIQRLEGNKVFYGWCNSTTSMDVVTESLTGKTSGTVLAGNGDYGDPCYGTYKYVKVVVELVDDPDYQKPETPTTTTEPKQIATPQNVAAKAGNGSADITWDASAEGNTEVVSYMVQVSSDNFENSITLNVTSLEALALGLANGQEYQVRVAGVNKPAGITSEWSKVVTVTPVAPAVTSTTSTTVAQDETAKVQTVTPVITPEKKAVEIAADTTTVECNKACFDAVIESLGVTEGPVYVSVDGGERIQLDGAKFTKIPVGKAGQKLTFMGVANDVIQQVSVPVQRSGEAAPAANTASGDSGSSSNTTLWLLLLLIAIVLGGGGYAVAKKRGNDDK